MEGSQKGGGTSSANHSSDFVSGLFPARDVPSSTITADAHRPLRAEIGAEAIQVRVTT